MNDLPPVLRELSTGSLVAELRRRARYERDQEAAEALRPLVRQRSPKSRAA